MFKLKNTILVMLFITGILQANTIGCKTNSADLRIITDKELCSSQNEDQPEESNTNSLAVETVNYSVHYDTKNVSFPVTVRTNTFQGAN